MRVSGKVCLVTGGASGIGAALCRRFAAEGAEGVVVVDRDADGAGAVAAEIGGQALACDVSSEPDVRSMVEAATDRYGRIDLLCNNAGICNDHPDFLHGPLDAWSQQWSVNVLGHVHTARAVLPQMLERGEGHLLQVASIAGILNAPGTPAYSATKHAAVGFAEWLSFTYGGRGIRVYLLCPLGVETPMLANTPPELRAASGPPASAEQVAQNVIDAFADERFLTYTDPDAATYVARKNDDLERWLSGMRRFQGSA